MRSQRSSGKSNALARDGWKIQSIGVIVIVIVGVIVVVIPIVIFIHRHTQNVPEHMYLFCANRCSESEIVWNYIMLQRLYHMHDSRMCIAAVRRNCAGCQTIVRIAESGQLVSGLCEMFVKATRTGAHLVRTQAVQHWLHEIQR